MVGWGREIEVRTLVRWNSAIASNSALRAAILRAAKLELASTCGLQAVAVVADLHTFFDNIPLANALGLAKEQSYPSWVLALVAACTWVWNRSHTPQAVARELLREHLQDPKSARFEAMRHFPTTNAVCGDIQRKDPSGRYARA